MDHLDLRFIAPCTGPFDDLHVVCRSILPVPRNTLIWGNNGTKLCTSGRIQPRIEGTLSEIPTAGYPTGSRLVSDTSSIWEDMVSLLRPFVV
jgi:hypothetical protein